MVKELIANPIFLTLVFAGLGAQALKVIIFLIKYQTIHPKDFVATGGMPSSHSALMTGLSTIIYLTEGFSTLFFVTLSLTLIVIVDAMGVRRTAGEEGKLLHNLIKKSKLKIKEPHYSLGHTPAQVTVGIIIGVVVAYIIFLL